MVAVVVAEIQFSLAAVSRQNNTEQIKFCKLNNLIIYIYCIEMNYLYIITLSILYNDNVLVS